MSHSRTRGSGLLSRLTRRHETMSIGVIATAVTIVAVSLAPSAGTYSTWSSDITANTASSILFAPTPPKITTTSLPNFVVGAPYSQQLAVTTGTPVTWSLADSSTPLPAGITLSSTGLISGTPTAGYPNNTAGTLVFEADNAGGSDTASFTVSVFVAPPAGSTITLNATINKVYSYQLPKDGNPAPTYALTSGSLPTGLTLSSGGLISGTPTSSGDYSAVVTATNSSGKSTYTVKISVVTKPVITSTSFSAPIVGIAYNQHIEPYNEPGVTYALYSGALPSGITINSYGNISGTTQATGTFTFTVSATNSAGVTTSTFSFTVGTPSLGIASTQYVYPNNSDSYDIAPTNLGNEGFTVSVTQGTLPTGLVADSDFVSIRGTASTSAATSTVTVRATNPGNAYAEKQVKFTVVAQTTKTGLTGGPSSTSVPTSNKIALTANKQYNLFFSKTTYDTDLRGTRGLVTSGLYYQTTTLNGVQGIRFTGSAKAGTYTVAGKIYQAMSSTNATRYYYNLTVTVS